MKNAVSREKYYKLSIYRILFFLFLFSLSICLVSEAKTSDYYYLNQIKAQKKADNKNQKNIKISNILPL